MTTTANDSPLVKASIHEPLYGIWLAEIEVDSPEALSGIITLAIEGVTYVGSVWKDRSAIDSGRWKARIAGGQAALGTIVAAKNYVGVNVRAAIDDLMTATAEALDVDASDTAVLARSLPKWHRMQGTAGNALTALMDEASSTFRIQRNGLLKVGAEDFTELDPLDDPFALLDTSPVDNSQMYGPLTPLIVPGVTIQNKPVSYVHTQVSGGSLRQTVWYQDL